jgi:hypothetical protein
VTPSDRYFPATILGGRLHIRGLPDWGSWNPSRLEWDDEAFVDMLLSKDQADRKARTREDLEAVMKEPKRAPIREVWMHEILVDEARRLWEQMVADLGRAETEREELVGEEGFEPSASASRTLRANQAALLPDAASL